MDKLQFVYVTYVETTPEKLWEALTNGDATAKYWAGERVQSAWTVGAPVTFREGELTTIQGEVLQYEPPRLLSYTFQFAGPKEEHPSRVVFDLDHLGPVVRLTLTHEGLDEKGYADVSRGWPQILSSLKTLLECGHALAYERWY